MKKSLFSCVSAAVVSAMMFTAAPVTSAQAANGQGSVSIIYQSGQNVGDLNRRAHSRRGGDDWFGRHHDRRFQRATCQPREAVRKAERFGLHRAEINRINNHLIVVSGRKRGQRLVVGMERISRNCEIAFVKRTF